MGACQLCERDSLPPSMTATVAELCGTGAMLCDTVHLHTFRMYCPAVWGRGSRRGGRMDGGEGGREGEREVGTE